MKRKLLVFLLAFSLLGLTFMNIPFTHATSGFQDFGGYEERDNIFVANHTQFWEVFNPHISWGLSCDGIPQTMNVHEEYRDFQTLCKYTLSFNTSMSGNYTISFIIDLEFEEVEVEEDKIKLKYKDEDLDFEFESEYNWADMFNLTDYDFVFSHVWNETGFYFFASDYILEGKSVLIDPFYEDFTTYIEIDIPANRIFNLNSTYVSHYHHRDEYTFLYNIYGTDFFGDFKWKLDVRSDYETKNAYGAVFVLSNTAKDLASMWSDGDSYIYISLNRGGANNKYITLWYRDNPSYDYDAYDSPSPNTWYYLYVEREGTTMTVDIYSTAVLRDAHGVADVDSLSITTDLTEYSHYMACCTWDDSNNYYGTNDIANLEFVGLSFITFYFNSGGLFRLDNVTLVNGTYDGWMSGTVLEFASLPQNSSYVWLNFTWDNGSSGSNPYNFTVSGNTTMWCYFSPAPEGYAGFVFLFLGLVIGVLVGAVIGFGSKRM